MLTHCYIIIKCTRTVLLPLAIMGKAPPLPPHTCQRSLWCRQIGWLYCLREERGQWMLTIDMYSLLGGHAFLWNIFLSQQQSPFLRHAGDMHSVPQRRLQFPEVIKFLKVFLPFLHVWPLSLLYEMCNPGREAGEASCGNTLPPGRPPGDCGHSPGLRWRLSQDPIPPSRPDISACPGVW